MPTLLSLAAMKAFALGRRAKWKDYVDLCFLIRDHFSVPEIIREAQRLFGDSFPIAFSAAAHLPCGHRLCGSG